MNEENKNIKKGYKNYTWLVLIALLALAFFMMRELYKYNEFFTGRDSYIFIAATLIGGFLAYSTIYQIGKLIFGLLSGMKLVSANILIFNFYKEKGKLKFSFGLPEGWVGSMLMVPGKEDYNKVKPVLYHFGGLFGYFFAALVSILVCLMLEIGDSTKAALYTSCIVAVIGFLVIFLNLIPLYSDGLNDGFTIRLLLNKNNKKAYLDNALQKSALLYSNGEIKNYEYDNYDDIFQAESLLYKYYFYMNQNDQFYAEKIVDRMIENKAFLSLENAQVAVCNKMYFVLLKEGDDYCYDYYYGLDKEYRKFAVSKNNLEAIKTGILLSAKVEKSYDVYYYLTKTYKRSIDKYYPSRRKYEIALIEKSIKLAEEKYPDWKDEE